MNTIDFLSSDIEFPCDSNEPKLSSSPCAKLPESVDWTFHDYYSTVLEKAFTPIQSITDIKHLEPVKENTAPPNYLKDWKDSSIFKIHDKQDDQAVVFVLANTIQSSPSLPQPPSQQDNLRAALRGALDLVESDMQKNMCDALRPSTPSSGNLQRRSNKDHYLTWKDDILAETLHIGTLDQDLWDDDDDDMLRLDVSPPYRAVDENPIIDSSLPSRISYIMPLSSSAHNIQSSQAPSAHPLPQHQEIQTPTANTPSLSPSTSLSPIPSESASLSPPPSSMSSTSPTKSSKRKSWNVWNKVKQAAQPITKQFRSSASSKNAFKRFFQH
ncbi:hypothetical protein BCR42DRAFT_403433 [Absidia repens]|uniref:Uncharacterized protein n=1 Tax=Absidia repens TaxID=90262 RepID=A0A1X2IZF6_9FUNG|nr:hypothetical protein BCR42DRAFT_403433 [Absidia repens]